MIVQDDCEPCDHFAAVLRSVVRAQPGKPIALFVGGQPGDACVAIRQAAVRGERWAQLSPWSFFPVVAAAWPVASVRAFLGWVGDANVSHHLTRADDAVAARFMQHERIWPVACVPSIVEHPDSEPSLIGRRAMAGADHGRVACLPIGERDGRLIDW